MPAAVPSTIVLYGNLTADPIVEAMPNGGAVVNFHISDITPKGEGFHRCVLVGEKAEWFAENYRSGDHLCVVGRLIGYFRPCECCQDDTHRIAVSEIWVTSVGNSGVYPPRD